MGEITEGEIQELYKEYAFIDSAVDVDFVKNRKSEDTTNGLEYLTTIIDRTYENANWYYFVFSPMDRAYKKDPDWFQVNGIAACKKWFKKPLAIVLTRELIATKTHINAIVCTKEDYSDYIKSGDDAPRKFGNRYTINVQRLTSLYDRRQVLIYITKERYKRTYMKYLDYLHSR